MLAGLLTTTSLKVAAVFGKEHYKVLSRIRALGAGRWALGAGRRSCHLFRLEEVQSKIGLAVANLLVATLVDSKSRYARLVCRPVRTISAM